MEKNLGHLFITSSSSHFFNKTDFEQLFGTRFFFSTNKPVGFRIGIINDAAKRSVKFDSDYNESLRTTKKNTTTKHTSGCT